jgi:membrane-associated PAP2 superfamily phosphatase
MTFARHILITLTLLVLVITLFHFTNLDIFVQNHFYDFTTKDWVVDAHDPVLKFIFYSKPKLSIISFGVLLLILYALSFPFPILKSVRYSCPLVILSLAFVPLLVAGSKQFTNHYCPAQTLQYGGDHPYVKLLENYPEDFVQLRKGKCFPAGHATAGFALMSLFFVFKSKAKQLMGLTLGLSLGWITGIYQMMKGAHFLSDTIVTMLASWLVILILREGLTYFQSK